MDKEYIEESDDILDITNRVECYEKGKTFECDCGHGIGVEHDVSSVRCASCGLVLVDRKPKSRGPPEEEEEEDTNSGGQASLSDWT